MKTDDPTVNTFIRIIKNLAVEYDEENGRYPESDFEGMAFYEFVCDKFGIEREDLDEKYPEVYK